MNKKPNLALIGRDISHSKSQEIYEKIIGIKLDYLLLDFQCEKDIPELDEIFQQYSLNGLSITAPYKKHFLKELFIKEEHNELNAINCIRKLEETINGKKFEAINTDFMAIDVLFEKIVGQKVAQVALLGDGAMSQITELLLIRKNIQYKVFSRKKNKDLSCLDLSAYFQENNLLPLIINSCAREFLFSGNLPKESIFWDYNYNHEFHAKNIPSKVGRYVDGIELLELQARYALDFWGIKF